MKFFNSTRVQQNCLAFPTRCTHIFISFILTLTITLFQVIIITNSDEGWVQFSAERYCPQLLPVVAKYRIVSARTRYEKFYPGQPLCWKAAAFAHEVNEIYEKLSNKQQQQQDQDAASSCGSMEGTDVSSTSSMESDSSMEEENEEEPESEPELREIISFGDSNEERTAVSIVSKQLDARPKSIKFLQAPTMLQIIGQLYMLTNHMQFVFESTKSLDMHITKQQADQCAKTYLKDNNIVYDETIVPNYVPRSRKSVDANNNGPTIL